VLFNWLKPKPPLGVREKAWVEVRMGWLAERFGIERLQRADVILPTEHYFPDAYAPTADAARDMMRRLGGYMGVDTSAIELEVLPADDMPGAAGLFRPAVIRIADA
jgi:hypothetical protein